jgi:hypothetical protein
MKSKLSRKPVAHNKAIRRWLKCVSGSGVDAMYSDVSKHWGFKWYMCQGKCTQTYTVQYMAAEQDCGPKVGPLVKFYIKERPRYGYLTQRATSLSKVFKTWNVDWYFDTDGYEGKCQQLADMGCPNFWKFAASCGFEVRDMHMGNIGYLTTTGRGVVIDFGHWYETNACDRYKVLYRKFEESYQDGGVVKPPKWF